MIGLVAMVALAATPITLEEVRTAARENPQALLAVLDAVRAHQGARTQGSALMPQLSVGASAGYEWTGVQKLQEPTTVFDPNTGQVTGVVLENQTVPAFNHPVYVFNATLTQALFDWTRFQSLAQAGAQEDAARAQLEEQRQLSEYEAMRRFYVLLTAQKSQEVLEANARRSTEQVERARALFEAARGSKGDVLAAQINFNNDRISATRQQATVAQAQADLASWLGRSEVEPLVAVDPGTLEGTLGAAPALAEVVATARVRRPLLQVVAKQLLAAERGVSAAVGGYVPRLKLQGFYQRYGDSLNPVFTDPRLQNDVTATVNLQWDLFNGLATDAAVRSAQASASTARIKAEQTARDVEGTLRVGDTALATALEIAGIADATAQTARQNLAYAQERFQAGAASTLEVRDAQLKLTQAELNLLQSRADVQVARAALARLSGTLDERCGVRP